MRKLRRSAVLGALAAVVVGSTLALRAFIAADPVVGSSELGLVPSMILVDEPARLLLAISAGAYGFGGFGGWSSGAEVQVLDEDGRALRSVQVGQRPAQALVDPRTGYLLVLTATAPGTAGALFSAPGAFVSVVDPRSGMVLRTITIPQPAVPGRGTFGGGGGRSIGGGVPPTPSPWQVAYGYLTPRRRGASALALDAARRHIFVGGGVSGANGQADLMVFDADSGEQLRSVPVPAPVSAVTVDPVAARVLVADRSGTITILDARSLTPVCTLSTSIASQLAVDTLGGRAFVLAASVGTVTTIDTTRGRLVGVAAVGVGARGIQVDEQAGHVFVESTGIAGSGFGFLGGGRAVSPGPGTVTMLSARSGKVLRTIPVGTLPFGAALDEEHHQLFVGNFGTGAATASGTVQVIDSARGVVLRTITVPTGPFSLALDTSRGRAVVAGLADQSQLHGPWPSAIEHVTHLIGQAQPTPTPSGPAGAVTILQAAH